MMVERVEAARSLASSALGEITAHSRECTLRNDTINHRLNKIENGIDKVVYAAGAVVISLIAWLIVQVYPPAKAGAETIAAASHQADVALPRP